MNDDLIRRSDAIEAIRRERNIKALLDIPTVESQHGEWIDLKTMDEWYTHVYKCSLCGCEHMYSNYCPNCGAKMKGIDDETD